MPWVTADVERHKKNLSDVQKEKWVATANSVRAKCIEDGGDEDDCDARAIRIANGTAAEVDMGELSEAVTKSVSGKDLPASSFLVVGDAEEVGTWALPVKDAAGNADHRRMGGAWAALHGGYRGKKYEGPGKAGAITKLKALYKAEDMPIPGEAEEADMNEALAMMSLGEQERLVRAAFQAEYGSRRTDEPWRYWVRDIFIAPSEFGNALVAEDNKASRYYLISYSEEGDQIVFADPPTWKTVVPTYRVEAVAAEADDSPPDLETLKLAEAYEGANPELLTAGIAEAESQERTTLKVKLIEPGFGNARDNNYYPAEMLRRDAHKFIDAKMHESDHKDDKSTRTWVSTVRSILGFSDTGAPLAEVVVHDPNFAVRVQNLAAENLLDKMECSILGEGKFKPGKVDGKKANIVEALTRISDVDWVTKAGAGGKALSIAESEDSMSDEDKKDVKLDEGTPPEEPKAEAPEKPLAEKEVAGILDETNLPESAKTYLAEGEYGDEAGLKEAVAKHIEYLKAVTGSGKPFGHEGGGAEVTMDETEYKKRYDGIMESHGVRQFGN